MKMIEFHDNKVGGASIDSPVADVVEKFIEWEKEKGQHYIEYYPFERRFLAFLLHYEVGPGLKCYEVFDDEKWEQIYKSYKDQK